MREQESEKIESERWEKRNSERDRVRVIEDERAIEGEKQSERGHESEAAKGGERDRKK